MPDDGSAAGDAAGRPIRVLVVDDHLLFAQALEQALSADPGIDVVATAPTIAGAVEALARAAVDVVLLDYRLPDTQGIEGVRTVVRAAPTAAVVLVTAVEDEQVLLAAVEAGCSGFVMKTADIVEVRAAVRRAASGEALISPAVLQRLLARLTRSKRRLGEDLSARERQVLALIVEGRANADIAAALFLSVHTVRNHVQSVLNKLEAHSKLEAAAIAVREGLLERP